MAVPELGKSGNLGAPIGSNGSARLVASREIEATAMTAVEESVIRARLSHIDETAEAIIAHVLDPCRQDAETRNYFIRQSLALPKPDLLADNRRTCGQCPNLTGAGYALRLSGAHCEPHFHPADHLPRRREDHAPSTNDPDQRIGRQR